MCSKRSGECGYSIDILICCIIKISSRENIRPFTHREPISDPSTSWISFLSFEYVIPLLLLLLGLLLDVVGATVKFLWIKWNRERRRRRRWRILFLVQCYTFNFNNYMFAFTLHSTFFVEGGRDENSIESICMQGESPPCALQRKTLLWKIFMFVNLIQYEHLSGVGGSIFRCWKNIRENLLSLTLLVSSWMRWIILQREENELTLSLSCMREGI